MKPLIDPALEAYAQAHTTVSPSDPVHTRLEAETKASTRAPQMQVGDLIGRTLYLLARLTRARLAVEVGTFTGCSALHIAEGLEEGGRLITCDIDPEATAIARRYWAQVPYGNRIELQLGPAIETLTAIEGPVDLAFIDADKAGYIAYWEALVPRMRRGGIVCADNVLWSGRVLDPKEASDHALWRFNEHVHADPRVENLMLPVRDGLTVARVL